MPTEPLRGSVVEEEAAALEAHPGRSDDGDAYGRGRGQGQVPEREVTSQDEARRQLGPGGSPARGGRCL